MGDPAPAASDGGERMTTTLQLAWLKQFRVRAAKYEAAAVRALEAGDHERHAFWAKRFHDEADAFTARHGIDPREDMA